MNFNINIYIYVCVCVCVYQEHINIYLSNTNILDLVWLVGFYGISTIIGYLKPNPLYTYLLNIYDLVGLDFMAYQTS